MMLFLGFIGASVAEMTPPPLKQYDSVSDIHDIKCKPHLTLIFKDNIWTPACIKPSSVDKLVERGWAADHDPHHMEMMATPSEIAFFTLQGDNKIGILHKSNPDAGPMMTYIDSSNDGSLVLATSSGSDAVYAYDKQGKLLSMIPVGETPKGVKIHPHENLAFVANENSGTISVVDVNSFAVTKEIQVGKIPHNIRFDSKGDTAYVTLQGEDKVAIIDVKNLEMTDSIFVDKLPHNLDLSPDDRYLYTANIGTSDVAVIDLDSKEITQRIDVSAGHHGIDVTNDGARIYVSGIGADKMNVIDAESLELIKQIDVGQGPHGIRASEDGSKVYVGVTTTNEIQVIDSKTLEIIDTIHTGNTPFWLAVSGNP
ncbi:beta-propeller fold lactonase family protein [Nitrosopumilus sp.]|uniref:YVTN family beta-propeller repeat protein n=1 Tax=Nitrosopumilus sp. TaxID=2024843 RepID=UPI00292D7F99|nr:beta-propeller fold lactonase family protein [Nitrosopumilus sp.]